MQEDQKIKKLWNQFKKSGLIVDYINYSKEKRKYRINEENRQK